MEQKLDLQWNTNGTPSIGRELNENGWATLESQINPDLVEEAYELFTTIVEEHPMPEPRHLLGMYATGVHRDGEKPKRIDEVRYNWDLDSSPVNQWHPYRGKTWELGKSAGITNSAYENILPSLYKEKYGAEELEKYQIKGDNDPKIFFHSTPASTVEVRRLHKHNGMAMPPEYDRLLTITDVIHEQASAITMQTLAVLEQLAPNSLKDLPAKHFAGRGESSSPLRILGYLTDEHSNPYGLVTDPDVQPAKLHFDKSQFTLALDETSPGLRVKNPNSGEMVLVEKDRYQIGCFVGASFPEGVYPKGYHDVISLPSQDYSDRFKRLSMIFFANSSVSGVASKEESKPERQ